MYVVLQEKIIVISSKNNVIRKTYRADIIKFEGTTNFKRKNFICIQIRLIKAKEKLRWDFYQ